MSRNSAAKPRRLAASHQRSWLWGRHAVLETLTAGHWPVIELLLDEELPVDVVRQVQQLVSRTPLRFERVLGDRLTDLCRSEEHQGFLARMGEFPCRSFQDLKDLLRSSPPATDQDFLRPKLPLFLVCDRIQDAHNFGAILRSCAAMHVDGVVIGEGFQVSVTPHVARASAGAVNHLTLFRVPNLSDALAAMKTCGIQTVAATEKSADPVWGCNLNQAEAVVIGSEATGIAPELLADCDRQVAIPMPGPIESLNAAVAAGIVLYECRRQQASGNQAN